jgi:Zn-dependent alcohol dehydrogenase
MPIADPRKWIQPVPTNIKRYPEFYLDRQIEFACDDQSLDDINSAFRLAQAGEVARIVLMFV